MSWSDNGILRTSGNAGYVLPDNPYPEVPDWQWKRRNITGGFWNSDLSYPYRPHSGVDYGANKGETVASYDYGEVIYCGWDDVFGNIVMIYHPAIDKTTLYAHLDSFIVSKGQHVKAQQKIATVGNTGSVNGVGYGDHLHIGIQDGKSTNLYKYDNTWHDFDTFDYQSNIIQKEKSPMILFDTSNGKDGNFTFAQDAHVLSEPNWTTGTRLTTYKAGETVLFEGMTFADNHTWLFYTKDGAKRYVPIQKGNPFGNFV